MRLHRFFIAQKLRSGELRIDDADLAHQLSKVLRMKTGDHVIMVDRTGSEVEAEILELSAKGIHVHARQIRPVPTEPVCHVTLCCALLKRENFEWVVQKATEVGVKEIVPIITDRTVKTGLKMERVQSIAKEAAEQSGRGMVPVLREPQEFSDAVALYSLKGTNIFFHTSSSVPNPNPNPNSILWIGPEGGWSDAEVSIAQENGFTTASLGSLTLRAETAAVVAAYLAVHGAIS